MKNKTTSPIRIWRAPHSDFGKILKASNDLLNETFTAEQAYDDTTLQGIAEAGFNAIWVHGLLQNIVRSSVFPEFGKNEKKHLGNLRKLIERADRFGIKVFLYMQPPRGLETSHPFWKKHPEVGGHEDEIIAGDEAPVRMRSLCTETSKVRNYLKDSAARLAEKLPELGGVILITASEYPSHCWGRAGNRIDALGYTQYVPSNCPRCKTIDPANAVCTVIQQIRDGIRSQSKMLKVIAWNWSWTSYEKAPCPSIIKRLPKDVILMIGFERGGSKTILGERRPIDEYSLSYSGPSAQFRNTLKLAQEQGIEMIAKLQIGTTHELATVPNLPVIGNLYDKAKALRKGGVYGFMGCWNFGNMLTANPAAFNRFMDAEKLPAKKSALKEFAADYFPGCDPENVAAAWEQFSEAMDAYPFSIPFMYSSPLNYSPSYPLQPKPLTGKSMGRSWMMDQRGDEVELSLDPYGLAGTIRGLGEVACKWEKGAVLLEKGLRSSDAETAQQELDNAWACYHVFRSGWNTYRTYRLRKNWSKAKLDAFRKIAANELDNLEQLLPRVKRDARLGYHSEAHAYMFNVPSIQRKTSQLRRLKEDRVSGKQPKG